jgi:hypothetical protein
MPTSINRRRAIACIGATLAPIRPTAAQPASLREGRQAILDLREEADAWTRGERELPEHPDYARRCLLTIERDDLLDQLCRTHTSRPAVDAYVRWQLTSYAPRIDELKDWQVDKVIRTLPRLITNPTAGEAVISHFNALRERCKTDRAYVDVMKHDWERLCGERDLQETLNVPARRYAEYWLEHARETQGNGGSLEPRIAWASLRLGLRAAWKVATEKGRLTRALSERRGNPSFEHRQRRALIGEIRDACGLSYEVLDDIRFYPKLAPRLTLGTRRISEDDAVRWIDALQDEGD